MTSCPRARFKGIPFSLGFAQASASGLRSQRQSSICNLQLQFRLSFPVRPGAIVGAHRRRRPWRCRWCLRVWRCFWLKWARGMQRAARFLGKPRAPRRAVRKVCAGCERQRALFRYHGVVKWDRYHTLCRRCFRAQRDALSIQHLGTPAPHCEHHAPGTQHCHESLYVFLTSSYVSAPIISRASSSEMTWRDTCSARKFASTRRARSCRAGIDGKARVSSLKPAVL